MSIATLIQDQRLAGSYDADGRLVIFDGDGPNVIRLTLEWVGEGEDRWRTVVNDGAGIELRILTPRGQGEEVAVVNALDDYFDVLRFGLGSREYEAAALDRRTRDLAAAIFS